MNPIVHVVRSPFVPLLFCALIVAGVIVAMLRPAPAPTIVVVPIAAPAAPVPLTTFVPIDPYYKWYGWRCPAYWTPYSCR